MPKKKNTAKKVSTKVVKPPTLADAYHKIEETLVKLEYVKFLLEDTNEWVRLSESDKKLSQDNIKTFYTKAHFQTSCLRDEILLTLQRIPNVRLARRKSNDNPTPQKTAN